MNTSGVRQLRLEGFREFSYSLNSLNRNEFQDFLQVVSNVRPKNGDLVSFVSEETKPVFARKQLIEFFSSEGESVLDVFSGSGSTLLLCSELERRAVGIEKDKSLIDLYERKVQEDCFVSACEVLCGDAKEVVRNMTCEKFDFIIVDPPFKKYPDSGSSLEYYPAASYALYLAELLNSLAFKIKLGRFVVLLVQDSYHKGKMTMISSMIERNVTRLVLNGVKIYYRDVDAGMVGNGRVYAPVINHFYALIFRRD